MNIDGYQILRHDVAQLLRPSSLLWHKRWKSYSTFSQVLPSEKIFSTASRLDTDGRSCIYLLCPP